MHIILVGFKSSGKTTVGKVLAKLTGKPFVDTDREVEKCFKEKTGKALTCREIFSQFGESYMRTLEGKALQNLFEKESCVVSTGGGIVLHEENRSLLHKSGHTIFLDVALPVLEDRLIQHASSPLFQEKSVAMLHAERYPLYKNASNIHYQIPDRCTPNKVAQEILRRINEDSYGK